MFSLIEGVPSQYRDTDLSHDLAHNDKKSLALAHKVVFLKTQHWDLINPNHDGSLLLDYVNGIFAHSLTKEEFDNVTLFLQNVFRTWRETVLNKCRTFMSNYMAQAGDISLEKAIQDQDVKNTFAIWLRALGQGQSTQDTCIRCLK